jgi:hypothetical protein
MPSTLPIFKEIGLNKMLIRLEAYFYSRRKRRKKKSKVFFKYYKAFQKKHKKVLWFFYKSLYKLKKIKIHEEMMTLDKKKNKFIFEGIGDNDEVNDPTEEEIFLSGIFGIDLNTFTSNLEILLNRSNKIDVFNNLYNKINVINSIYQITNISCFCISSVGFFFYNYYINKNENTFSNKHYISLYNEYIMFIRKCLDITNKVRYNTKNELFNIIL